MNIIGRLMNIIGRLPTITHKIIHGYTVAIYTTNNICHVIKEINA